MTYQKIVDGVVADMTPEEIAAWEAEQAEYVPLEPSAYRLYKSTLVRRTSLPEAAALETLLNEENAWLRQLYHSVEYFMSDDALFSYLALVLGMSLGDERATELLAAET